MRKNAVPVREALTGASPTKAEDDSDFKARWIPLGMHLKKRGDALGINWREQSFEEYMAAIFTAEKWAAPEGVEDA